MRLFLIGCVAVVAACAPPPTARPFTGALPTDAQVDLTGSFTLTGDGTLRLALASPCVVATRKTAQVHCSPEVLRDIHVVARTPWNQDVLGAWNGPAYIEFRPDWKVAGLDPLADDAAKVAARPWDVSGTQWTPTPAQASAILKLVGNAVGVETEVVRGGPPPSLDVTELEIEGGTLRTGESNSLVVRIANRGPGVAYRVVVTTRCSVDALHGRRLSFGGIKPGSDKSQRLQVTVPTSETAPDAMLVLTVSEASGGEPRQVSRRIPLGPSTAAPVLAVQCKIGDRQGAKLDLDAGQRLVVRCNVDNTGNAAAKQVDLDVSVAGAAPVRSAQQAIGVAGHAAFEVPVLVPRGLPIDAPVEIAITARDRSSQRLARATLVGVVRKPKLCVPGELTREQYQAKVKELRAAVAAGDITQAQFDRYDAELVTCLK